MKKVPSSLGILVLILTIFFPREYDGLPLTRNISAEIESQLEDFITNVYLPGTGTGGLGIAIVGNNGEMVYTAGFGMADHERNVKNGNDTQFLIGSVTKSFTSLVVVKTLHEQFPELGEKVLDTPIRKLLAPQLLSNLFTLGDRFRSEQVTFRDLLAHRVCLVRNDLPLMAEAVNSTKEVVFRQRYAKEACGFRTKFQYNNQMYVVAGELIGAIAGRPFEDLAAEFLVAIGMHNSSFIRQGDDFSQMPHRAMPYYVKDNVTHPINPELVKRVVVYNAAGGLFATPNDMAKYLSLHLNSGKLDNEQVIPAEPMSWLTKAAIHLSGPPTFKTTSDDGLYYSVPAYGLGLFLGSYNGWQFNSHGGSFPPYLTHLVFYPGLQIGIFLSFNEAPVLLPRYILEVFIVETLRSSSGKNATEEAMKIWDKFERNKKVAAALMTNSTSTLTPPPPEEENKPNETEHTDVTMVPVNSTELVGEYGMGDGGEVFISERPNPSKTDNTTTQLYLSYGRWTRGWLKPWNSNSSDNSTLFEIEWDTDIVQDIYAAGGSGDYKNIVKFVVDNGTTLECVTINTKTMKSFTVAVFRRGVNWSTLPEIPWAENSCATDRGTSLKNNSLPKS